MGGLQVEIERRRFKRALIKLSGEALAGPEKFGLHGGTLHYIAAEIGKLQQDEHEVAVVVGGGNFVRGETYSADDGIDRSVADQMGMLGTLMNALALQSAMEHHQLAVRVQSAINVAQVAEAFIRRRAIRHMEKGRIVIFAAGTGNPFFTTDTAAVLRALEIEADVLIKATKVDGVYDSDPRSNPSAVRYDTLNYSTAIEKRLGVMDQTAFTMCREHGLPIIVLDFNQSGSLRDAVSGRATGTLVGGD
jgi:uridylate kinase